MKAVLKENIWIEKLSIANLPKIKRSLTFIPRYGGVAIPAYAETADLFGFPRYYKLVGYDIEDNRTEGMQTDLEFIGTPRDYQIPAIKQFEDSINRGATAITLNAQTGTGKTVILLYFLSILKRAALIIVPKTDLITQWREEILKFTSIKPEEIGIAQQDKAEYEGKKITIGTIQSLCKDKYSEEFKRHFGVVAFDELHRTGASGFSNIMKIFPAKYRLGCSATLDRADGMDVLFRYHLGRNEIVVKKEMPAPKVIVYKYSGNSGQIPKYLKEVTYRRASLFSMLAKNQDRNMVIANFAKQLSAKRQTVVLTERKQMTKDIKQILISKFDCDSRDVGIYVYETSKAEKKRIGEECSIILATTKMMNEGTNIPSLRALIYATPLSGPSIQQPLGRIRRIKEGVEDPVVLDFVDTQYKEAKRWFNSRMQKYRSWNFKIEQL